jgi:taurine dioxygenase
MQAACAALPPDSGARIEGRRIKHDGTYNFGRLPAQGRDADRRSHGGTRRLASGDPWRHPGNGRATLYFGRRRKSSVEGYSRAELRRAAGGAVGTRLQSPRFVYQHV